MSSMGSGDGIPQESPVELAIGSEFGWADSSAGAPLRRVDRRGFRANPFAPAPSGVVSREKRPGLASAPDRGRARGLDQTPGRVSRLVQTKGFFRERDFHSWNLRWLFTSAVGPPPSRIGPRTSFGTSTVAKSNE